MRRITCIFLTLLILLSLVGCRSNTDPTMPDVTTAPTTTEPIIEEIDSFEFADNWDELTDEWWNEKNSLYPDKTNREAYEMTAGSVFGNTYGKLSMRPMDCSMPMIIGGKLYSLNLNNNNCLIPQQLKNLDDKTNAETSSIYLAILTKNTLPFLVFFHVAEMPDINFDLPDNQWTVLTDVVDDKTAFKLYYPINKSYCLTTNLSTLYVPNNSANEPDVDDVNAFVKQIISTVSVQRVTDYSVTTCKTKLETVALDDRISLNLKDVKIVNWHSGAPEIAEDGCEGDNVLTVYNAKGKTISIVEYNKDKNIGMTFMQNQINTNAYEYCGKQIYLCKYKESAGELAGACAGILFEANGQWYYVSYTHKVSSDIQDIDKWIADMIQGILIFTNEKG